VGGDYIPWVAGFLAALEMIFMFFTKKNISSRNLLCGHRVPHNQVSLACAAHGADQHRDKLLQIKETLKYE
jgi:hypothetical protein